MRPTNTILYLTAALRARLRLQQLLSHGTIAEIAEASLLRCGVLTNINTLLLVTCWYSIVCSSTRAGDPRGKQRAT